MDHVLRAIPLLQKSRVPFPAPIIGGTQSPVTPTSGNPISQSSAGIVLTHLYISTTYITCMYII